MTRTVVDFPVFDADNHMYETPDAFTKFLPAEYAGLIKYVKVGGRDKIAVRNVISDYIPNPTFSVVAKPGAQVGRLWARPCGRPRLSSHPSPGWH